MTELAPKFAQLEAIVKAGQGQQELSVAGIALADAEGRRWHFHSAQDFLMELARRTTDLQLGLARERHLREQNLRTTELELQQEERREQRLETMVLPAEYATSEADRVTRREAVNVPMGSVSRLSREGGSSRPSFRAATGRFDPDGD